MSLKILIIEDEHLGIERLERHLFSIDPVIEIAGTADSVKSAVNWLQTNEHPDLILMDIDLGDGQSFDIFNEVTISSHIIFTTSYDEHALQAFETNGIDYLLKPIKKRELKDCLDKFKATQSTSNGNHTKQDIEELVKALQQQLHLKEFRQRFLVKQGKKLISIELHEISYFYEEALLTYVKTKDKQYFVIDHHLDELEHMLDRRLFFRISNAYLVAVEGIKKIHQHIEGQLMQTLSPGNIKTLIGSEKVPGFRAWMEDNHYLFIKLNR